MKRIILSIGIFLLFFSFTSLGDEVYSLKSIEDIALKNSIDLKISALNLSNAQINYKKDQANNLLTQSKTLELQSKISLLSAQDSYNNTKNQIILNIVKEAINVVKDELTIAINQKQLKLQERNLNDIKAQVDAGYMGNLDLLSAQNKYDNALFSLQKAIDNFEEDMRKLLMDLSIDPKKKITIEIPDPVPPKVDKAILLNKTLENSLTLKIKNLNVKLAQINLEKAQKVETPTLDLDKLRNNLEIAKLSLEKEKESILSSFYTQYFLFVQAISNLNIAKSNLKEKKESYDIIQKQYEAGLKTETDVLQAEINLLNAKLSVKSAISDYWTNKIRLENIVGEEIKKEEKTQAQKKNE